MAKATRTAEAAVKGYRLVTLLVEGDFDEDAMPQGASVIHESEVKLDFESDDISSSGKSFSAVYASVAGDDAPTATVRFDGRMVKAPLTIVQQAYITKKALDRALARRQ